MEMHDRYLEIRAGQSVYLIITNSNPLIPINSKTHCAVFSSFYLAETQNIYFFLRLVVLFVGNIYAYKVFFPKWPEYFSNKSIN